MPLFLQSSCVFLSGLILGVSACSAQGVVEDFACTVPASVSNASPAIVACPGPHNFNMQAYVAVGFSDHGSNGDTLRIDGVTYTFVTRLDNAAPNQVLIGQGRADTAWSLFHAINDDGYGKGITYSNATKAHATFSAGTSFQAGGIYLLARKAGPEGIGKSVVSSAPSRIEPDTPTSRMEWNLYVSGATGSWTSIGTNQTPRFFFARYVDPTHFALYTNRTTPYDSTRNGLFNGQSLTVWRAGPQGNYYPTIATGESWSLSGAPTNDGFLRVNIPGCPNPAHELECSMAQCLPELGHNSQGNYQKIKSFEISNGIGTITLVDAFPSASPTDLRKLLPGAAFWLRNVTDTPGTWTHTINLPNHASGTAANHLVKYVPGTETAGRMQNLDVGGAIGVCQSNCGTSGAAVIADAGQMTCTFDNPTVGGHWVTGTGYDDRCHDAGPNFPISKQALGVVRESGAAGDHKIWWNGLNRAYVVQSANGSSDGRGVTRITIKVPGYPDGNYAATTMLPGINNILGAGLLSAIVDINFRITPYVMYPAISLGGYVYPLFTRHVKNWGGLDPATANRLTFWIKWNKDQMICGADYGTELGTYIQPPGFFPIQGQHYYHNIDPSLYAGQWIQYTFNLTPSHEVSVPDSTWNYYNDLYWQGTPFGWHGQAHYLDHMGTFYQDLSGIFCGHRDVTGQDILLSPVMLSAVTDEPEELVKTRSGVWTPKIYRTGDRENTPSGDPGYEITWGGPKGIKVQYEIRYSTKGPLKAVGFSNGLCRSGTTTCGPSDRLSTNGTAESVLFQSRNQPQQKEIWWGIKPVNFPIASTTGAGQNPTWIITAMDMGFAAGDKVAVAGVTGNTAANQSSVALAAVRPRQVWTRFDARPPAMGIEGYVAGSGPVQIRIANHGLMSGQNIQIFNATPPSLNGQHTVAVIDANTFTVDGTSSAACPCSGGSVRLDLPGTITNIVSDGRNCTANLTVPHNLQAGWKIYIWGAPEAHLSPADAVTPASFTVSSTPTPQSFGFACPGVPARSYDTDQPPGNFTISLALLFR
jgi:hypothetical protein